MNKKTITVEILVNAPIEKVWEFWTEPKHIIQWNFASDDWECPRAQNNLKVDGKFKIRMSAKDGSAGFDFEGTYTVVKKYKVIEYLIVGDDSRKVQINFTPIHNGVKISEIFEMENENSEKLQREGWQSILNNFKNYAENLK